MKSRPCAPMAWALLAVAAFTLNGCRTSRSHHAMPPGVGQLAGGAFFGYEETVWRVATSEVAISDERPATREEKKEEEMGMGELQLEDAGGQKGDATRDERPEEAEEATSDQRPATSGEGEGEGEARMPAAERLFMTIRTRLAERVVIAEYIKVDD